MGIVGAELTEGGSSRICLRNADGTQLSVVILGLKPPTNPPSLFGTGFVREDGRGGLPASAMASKLETRSSRLGLVD